MRPETTLQIMLSTPLTFAKRNDNIAKRDHIAKRNDIVSVLELALELALEKTSKRKTRQNCYTQLHGLEL